MALKFIGENKEYREKVLVFISEFEKKTFLCGDMLIIEIQVLCTAKSDILMDIQICAAFSLSKTEYAHNKRV